MINTKTRVYHPGKAGDKLAPKAAAASLTKRVRVRSRAL